MKIELLFPDVLSFFFSISMWRYFLCSFIDDSKYKKITRKIPSVKWFQSIVSNAFTIIFFLYFFSSFFVCFLFSCFSISTSFISISCFLNSILSWLNFKHHSTYKLFFLSCLHIRLLQWCFLIRMHSVLVAENYSNIN